MNPQGTEEGLKPHAPTMARLDREPETAKGLLSDSFLDRLEHWLDRRFRVPGTGYRFGLDGIIGLVPGIGDALAAGLSGLFILDAYKNGARKRVLAKMTANVVLDSIIGAIPLVGDLFDFAFKSNTKNLVLLKEERKRIAGADRSV